MPKLLQEKRTKIFSYLPPYIAVVDDGHIVNYNIIVTKLQ